MLKKLKKTPQKTGTCHVDGLVDQKEVPWLKVISNKVIRVMKYDFCTSHWEGKDSRRVVSVSPFVRRRVN